MFNSELNSQSSSFIPTLTQPLNEYMMFTGYEIHLGPDFKGEFTVWFKATSRNDSKYYMEDMVSQTIIENNSTYAIASRSYRQLIDDLKETFVYYGIPLTEELKDCIREAATLSFSKCESTYGSGVNDNNEWDSCIKFCS